MSTININEFLKEQAGAAIVLDPRAPLPSAREFMVALHTIGSLPTLRHQAETFYCWQPEKSVYEERPDSQVRTDLYTFLEQALAKTVTGKGNEKKEILVPFQPTKHKVSDVLDALRAATNLPNSSAAPCWLSGPSCYEPLDILPTRSGLLHIPSGQLLPATPEFFALSGADVDFDPSAPEPKNWLKFLNELWPKDLASIDLLGELFGYLLTPHTGLQKIAMIIGPTRAGKGTLARVLKVLCGERNCCSPTLDNIGDQFGREHLIDKSVAIISDARIGSRTDGAAVCERLLSISGEDHQSVPRKFKPAWQGQLRTRFLILTNALPRIEDESGAFSSRFVLLTLKQSFLGREDPKLFDSFIEELPGVLNWALKGRTRLWENKGKFTQPQASVELIEQFKQLSSSITVFLEDRCRVESGRKVSCAAMYTTWRMWCEENGRLNIGSAQTFARDLHAARPELKTIREGTGNVRPKYWHGVELS